MSLKLAGINDRKIWDDFLATQANGNFRQSFAWGQIKKLAGWEPVYLYVEDGGKIWAAISMLKRRIPFVGKSILYGCRGPVLDWNNTRAFKKLIEGVKQYARKHGCIFLRIDPEPVNEIFIKKQLSSLNFLTIDRPYTSWNRTRYELRLFLDQGQDELFSKIRKKTRQHINSAYRKGVSVKIGFEEGDDKRFHELMSQLEFEKKAIPHSFEYYKTVVKEIVSSGGTIIKAIYDGKIISAMLMASVGERWWAVYMANDYEYRNLMPNKLIYWEGIKFAKKKGGVFFDMGATQGASFDHSSNLDFFKMAYKPEVVHFPEYFDLVFSPLFYKVFNMMEFKLVPFIYNLKTIQLRKKKIFGDKRNC